MLFLEESANPKCLHDYIKASHECIKHHHKIASNEYATCISIKTFELEACSLQELLDDEDFHQYDVDVTAWLKLKEVQNTQAKLQALIDATEETTVRTAAIHNNPKMKEDYSPGLYKTW
jgi:hypothetical protein